MHSDLFRRVVIPAIALGALAIGGGSAEAAPPSNQDFRIAALQVPAAAGSLAPNLSAGAGRTLVLSWVEPDGGAHRLRYSVLADGAWSEPRTVASGDDWFVNWADFPSVVPLSDSLWAAHWMVRQPAGGYAYDVALALSQDGGSNWSVPVRPHDDRTATEHGFVTLFPSADGVGVIWLDGRNMAGQAHTEHANHGMTLRAATLGTDLRIGNEAVIDGLTCDCCQTDVAVTATGALAVYRNRTAEETRDIYAARLVNGAWEPGRPVAEDGWTIAGCPVNGPVIAADGNRAVIAWFTAADDEPRVRIARSTDAGATFSAPVDVVADQTSGHVGLALLPDNGVAVSWTCELSNGNTGVCLRAISGADEPGPVHVLSGDGAVPPLSVPQLARHHDVLVAAWTEKTDGGSAIASGRLPIAALH
ncbi:MAG TPA: sialidase family protein [Woeseiaceae bacterium]|nr:sialidase family protein [Woeseiaceae bacterium]